MFKWIREFYELKFEILERRKKLERDIIDNQFMRSLDENICKSCETLKLQLAIANDEKRALLDRILEKPVAEATLNTDDLKPIVPRTLPWNARRQALEAEDRAAAKILKQNKTENVSTADLEQAMDNATKEREATTGKVNAN